MHRRARPSREREIAVDRWHHRAIGSDRVDDHLRYSPGWHCDSRHRVLVLWRVAIRDRWHYHAHFRDHSHVQGAFRLLDVKVRSREYLEFRNLVHVIVPVIVLGHVARNLDRFSDQERWIEYLVIDPSAFIVLNFRETIAAINASFLVKAGHVCRHWKVDLDFLVVLDLDDHVVIVLRYRCLLLRLEVELLGRRHVHDQALYPAIALVFRCCRCIAVIVAHDREIS